MHAPRLQFPALRHHGKPRERSVAVPKRRLDGRDRRQRFVVRASLPPSHGSCSSHGGLTRRARTGSAGPSLLTWLPPGQWSGADRNRRSGAFGPKPLLTGGCGNSSEIKTLSRVRECSRSTMPMTRSDSPAAPGRGRPYRSRARRPRRTAPRQLPAGAAQGGAALAGLQAGALRPGPGQRRPCQGRTQAGGGRRGPDSAGAAGRARRQGRRRRQGS